MENTIGKKELIEILEDLVCCPAFNSQIFEKDKESHKAWTLGRYALEKLKGRRLI